MSKGLYLLIGIAFIAGTVLGDYNIELISDTPELTAFRVEIGEPNMRFVAGNSWLLSNDGFGRRGEEFGPRLYGRTYQIAVPKGSEIEVSIESVEWSNWIRITPASECPPTVAFGQPGFESPQLYATPFGGTVEYTGTVAVRGVEIANIDLIPVEYNPDLGVRFMKSVTIAVAHNGPGPTDCGRRLYHPMFEKLYRAMLVNPEAALPRARHLEIAEWDPADGAELLVVVRTDFEDELQPWVDWKLLMGMPTHVVTTSVTGTDTASIHDYIQDAYDTWAIPPVYVLLVSDADYIPPYEGSGGLEGDNHYCVMDGADYYPDIFPGRISANTSSHMETIVQKHLNFEMQPDTTDDWYARAVGIVNEDDPTWDPLGPQDSSYLAAVTYGMNQCLAAGFTSAPILRRKNGDNFNTARPYVEAGCTFIQYRGQAYPDYYYGFAGGLDTLDNDGKCPINISITCGTGGYMYTYAGPRMCERSTRAGSASNPKGAVAFIGQSLVSTNSEERSSLSKHIFEGMFEEDINAIGAAHTYGKNGMLSEFGGSYDSKYEYLSSVLIGSPEMLAWTAPIQNPYVTHPSAVSAGPNNIDVNVSAGGSPVEQARVAIHQGSVFSYGITDASGDVSISIDVDPANPLVIVATGPNIYPYQDTIDVVMTGVAVFCAPVGFDDFDGDGDGLINPGERVRFYPRIFNMGTEGAGGLTGVVRCNEVDWFDSTTAFPYVGPDDTVTGDEVLFSVPSDHPGVEHITFTISISGHPSGPWERTVVPEPGIHRFAPMFENMAIIDDPPYGDGDGEIAPGEVVEICLDFSNNTQADADSVMGFLIGNEEVAVIQNYGIVESWPRTTSQIFNPCYSISISPEAEPGTEVTLGLAMHGLCSIYEYIDTLPVPITLIGNLTNRPTGPDAYGYYIIDDTDSFSGLEPTYVWNDISSIGTEISPSSDCDDCVTTVTIPFSMVFYGVSYDTITVAANGYIAPGVDGWSGPGSGSPQEIPNTSGPEGFIAPGWADLAPHRAEGGEIYGYYDTSNHQVAIQWDDCEFYYGGGYISCQLRICDPSYWPTPTGDSEFYIYYQSMSGIGVMGTGIEAESETDGLQYYLNGVYDEHAAELTAGRALRITTIEPGSIAQPWLYYLGDLHYDDSMGDSDDIIEPGEIIGVRIRIENGGGITATSTYGEILGTTMLTPYGSAVSFGSIAPGANAYNLVSMKCEVSASCPMDTVIEVPVQLEALGGTYSTTFNVYMRVGGSVGMQEFGELPRGISLGPAYPNPFNSVTSMEVTIGYDVDSPVKLSLYDITGRCVGVVHDGVLSPGRHIFRIDFDDTPSGIYFVRLRWGDEYKNRKILLIE